MANFLLSFLQNAAQGMASPFEYLAKTDIVDPVKELTAQATSNNQAYQNAYRQSNIDLGLGAQGTNIGQGLRTWAGNSAQVGLDVATPAIGKEIGVATRPVTRAAMDIGGDIAGKVGSRLLGGVAKGAIEGGVLGGAQGVANTVGGSQPLNAKNLTMSFLQGAGAGVLQGGVFGAVGGVDDQTASDIAASNDPKEIEQKLEPVVGPAVAHDVAPSLAHESAKDPNVVQQMVQNDVAKKLPNPQPATPNAPPTGTSPEEMQSIQQQGESLSPKERGDTAPFMNAPGENNTTHIGKLDAMTKLHDDLNAGVSATDAISKYMETTGDGWQDAQKAYQAVTAPGSSVERGKINATLNPEYERTSKLLPDVAPGNRDQAMINPQVVHNELARLANAAAESGSNLSENDRSLMDQVHGKTLQDLLPQAKDKAAFTDAFSKLKKYDDTVQGLAAGQLGVEVPYRQNHGLSMKWDNTPEEVQAAQAKKAQLSKTPGWSQGRQIANYAEGEKLGLTRANDNIYQDLQQDLKQKQSFLGQRALQKGLEQAYPGQVKVGDIGSTPEGTYKQLQVPYGNKLSMPADIANAINERAPAPTSTGGWKTYDDFNSNWKNLKLAGGGFHSLNTLGNWFGQQIASGNIFKHPEDSANVLRSMFDPKFAEQKVQEWNDSGATLQEDRAGLNANYHAAEGDLGGRGKLGNIPGLKQVHDSVFGRQIPFMMKQMFHQQTEGLDLNTEEGQAQSVKIAKQINQQFGAFNRDIQGVTARTAKLAGRGVLAWDWNEGQVRTLADAISKGGIEGKLARQTVFGKALLFAGLATAAGAVGGEFKGKDPKQVALDILQKTVNPSFQFGNYTVGLPATQVSELGKPITQTISNAINGKSVINPTKDMLASRLAAIPSGVEQLTQNRSFSGNTIYGNDYFGRPIGAGQTAINLAGMAAPIPVSQAVQTISGQQPIGATAANIAGLNVRPTYDLAYAPVAGQTYVQALKQAGAPADQIQADTQFFDLLGTMSTAKKSALNKAEGEVSKKTPAGLAAAQKTLQSYNAKLIQTLQPWATGGGAKYFDSTMMAQLRASILNVGTATKYARTDIKNNPTAYGMPLSASSIAAGAAANVASQGNNGNNKPI